MKARTLGENDQRPHAPGREDEPAASGLESALDTLPEVRALSRVTYAFHAEGAEAHWEVTSMELREGVSAPYEARVALVSLEGDDPKRLLGRTCTLRIQRDDAQRAVHGIVNRVEHGEPRGAARSARVRIVPALAVLGLRSDCRIFQDLTVPEILERVLGPALASYDRTLALRLRRTDYPRREYVVQYRESDLAFAERLMADEGIWYCFEQPSAPAPRAAERLLLLDQNDDVPRARFGHDGERLPLGPAHAPVAFRQSVAQLVCEQTLASTSVQVHAYDWTNPWLAAQARTPEGPGERPRYEPFGVSVWEYQGGRYTRSDASAQAAIRRDALPGRAERLYGRGNVVGMSPGQRFEVSTDPLHRSDTRWIVTSVEARGRDARRSDRDAEEIDDYACEFRAVRADVPLRTPSRPKPCAYGVQTALVVGADGKPEVERGGDDVHVDEHGRIQVRFHWDRSEAGGAGATTTCFLRVAQGWAGGGMGMQFLPRVGTEVVVSFVDGDPDRPLVTGCLYNGLHRALYDLPAHKTRSFIRTRSSPGQSGANELSFEDADGQEQVALHAQRDHREVVGRDQTVEVGHDRRLHVRGDATTRVDGDDRHDIGKSRITTLFGPEALAIIGPHDRTIAVGGSASTQIEAARRLEVGGGDTEAFGGGRAVTVRKSDRLEVLGGAHKNDHVSGQYNIAADTHFRVAQGATELYMNDAFYVSTQGDVQLKNAGFHLRARADGTTEIAVQRELTLRVGSACIRMDASGTVEISGPLGAALTAQGGALTATATEAVLRGPRVTVQGETLTEVKAPLVKIN